MKGCQIFTEIFPIKENWHSLYFDFAVWKNYFPGQFLASCNSCRYHPISKFLVAPGKIRHPGGKVGVVFLLL